MRKQKFGTSAAAREYLVGLGFPPFKQGLTSGEFKANGRVARLSMGLAGRTGQSSTGTGWCFIVAVEEAA